MPEKQKMLKQQEEEFRIRSRNALLAFDWREDSEADSGSTKMETIGWAVLKLDLYGRVLKLQVDEANRNLFEELRVWAGEVLDHDGVSEDEMVPLPDRMLLWVFRLQDINSGGLCAQAILLDQDWPNDNMIRIYMPPPGLHGVKLRKWREDHQSRDEPDEEAFAKLIESAQWMVRRVVRAEPLLGLEDSWKDFRLFDEVGDLLAAVGANPWNAQPVTENEPDAKPNSFARIVFSPEGDSGTRLAAEKQPWPEIEIDILLQADGFPVQTRDHRGQWSLTKGDDASEWSIDKGLVTLEPDGFLRLYGFSKHEAAWPTNLMARRPLKGEKCCVWRPGWRWWCGYRATDTDSYVLKKCAS